MYGEMDEEMEDFVAEFVEAHEVDYDYEFDAARFFDFTRPESSSETEESERWFESAGSYPPSPFVVKFKWREETYVESTSASFNSIVGESKISSSNNLGCGMDCKVLVSDGNREGTKYHDEVSQDTLKTRTKSVAKSSGIRSSTLMKPTASHLAKLKGASEIHSIQFLGRSQKSIDIITERSSRSPLAIHLDATKRQKLENGYLRKVARLKHQNLLLHKLSKDKKQVPQAVANTVNSRLKATIPREPDLETAHRAQRHRSKNNSDSGVSAKSAKSKPSSFKARPLDRKIFNTPPLTPQKKSRPQAPAYQVFRLKTSERNLQCPANKLNIQNSLCISTNGTADIERLKYEDAPKPRKPAKSRNVRPLSKQIICCKKDVTTCQNVKSEDRVPAKFKHPADNILSYNPPTELFQKLSLKSELEGNTVSRPKQFLNSEVPKENVLGSFKREILVS